MDNVMAQLESLEVRYEEIQEMMADPEVIADTKRYMEITKEEADMREVVQKFRKFKADKEEIAGNKEIIADGSDPELVEMAKMENSELEDEISQLEDEIKILMLPKDPNDDKDIIMEIRGAAGGDEASLFAGDLLRMYEKYAENQGWNVSIVDSEQTEVGGYKRVAIMITGNKVYSKLKYENGAHRVQRIPVTESAAGCTLQLLQLPSCQNMNRLTLTLIQRKSGWTSTGHPVRAVSTSTRLPVPSE